MMRIKKKNQKKKNQKKKNQKKKNQKKKNQKKKNQKKKNRKIANNFLLINRIPNKTNQKVNQNFPNCKTSQDN